MNDRIALVSAVNLGLPAIFLDGFDRLFNTLFYLGGVFRIDGDSRNFNEAAQECFKLLPL
jgi:hypothetical protein